jgi:hypothetical protein
MEFFQLSEMAKNRKLPGGVRTVCKWCKNLKRRKYMDNPGARQLKQESDRRYREKHREERRASGRQYRKENLVECRRRERERNSRPEARQRRRESSRRHYEANRESVQTKARLNYEKNRQRYSEYDKSKKGTIENSARQKLNSAVKLRKIIKPKCCQDCDENVPKGKLHGHRNDYNKPLDVEWLCSACHGVRHRK